MKENSGEILRITGDVMQSIFTVKHSNECDPYVLEKFYQDSPYIVLFISPDNLPSIQVALQNGFYVDYGMDEENEMFGHTPYVKRNTYYKKDNQS